MNIRLPSTIFALCAGPLVADGSGQSDRGKGSSDRGHRGSWGIHHFIRKADTDRDGAVSREEFGALERISSLPEEKQRELFKRLDKNGDGQIRSEELRPPRHRGGGPPRFPSTKDLDLDDDGEVTFKEFLASEFVQRLPEKRRRAFFDHLDRDDDGVLTTDDQRHWGKKGRRGPDPKHMFSKMDRNDDGAVDPEEFSAAPWHRGVGEDELKRRFEFFDRDGDGAISKREFLEFEVDEHHRDDDRGPRRERQTPKP